MRHVYWVQVGLLLLIILLAVVHSLLSLRLQSKEQHISISLQACGQAARLGRCAHESRPQVRPRPSIPEAGFPGH